MLKYLFEATFKDNSIYKQTKDDISLIDPKRSCFFDVTQKLEEVTAFKIVEQGPLLKNSYSVDLETGKFYIKGIEIQVGDHTVGKRKLIFYRQHEQDATTEFKVKTGKILNIKPAGHRVKYFIGWEAKDNKGNNIKSVIGIE